VLASDNRLTSSADFKKTTQLGARVSTKTLAGYALIEPTLTAPKIGFIVSRAIGGSVARHRVTRQLRHLSRENINLLPNNSFVVVTTPRITQAIPKLFSRNSPIASWIKKLLDRNFLKLVRDESARNSYSVLPKMDLPKFCAAL
jgi:ribonuclease P protein component